MARLKICAASGCDDFALPGLSHCERHEDDRQGKIRVRRAKAKTSEAALLASALYADPKWKAARRSYLRQHPICVDCGELGVIEAATDVDHITPHKGDRKLFWDRSNWQALCHSCHSRKTAREVFHGGPGGV